MRTFLLLLPLLLALGCSSSDSTDDVTACAEEACAKAPNVDACVAEGKSCVAAGNGSIPVACATREGLDTGELVSCLRDRGYGN